MAGLDLFPSRVRWVDERGILTPEALRALQTLFTRVGGVLGDGGVDTFSQFLASMGAGDGDSSGEAVSAQVQVTEVLQPLENQPLPYEAHPVGSYVFLSVSTNPAVLFGYGTWTQIGGGFPAAYLAGDPDFGVLGATGGARTIAIDDHDPHTHTTTASLTLSSGVVQSGVGSSVVDGVTANPTISSDETPTLTHTLGGVSPIPILPPYMVTAVWRRDA